MPDTECIQCGCRFVKNPNHYTDIEGRAYYLCDKCFKESGIKYDKDGNLI